jgi:hypothetical protein
MTLLAQKSLLAKLMATENLTIRQAKVQTASFDVLNRVLTVPILEQSLSKEIYDLFMGHEVGHALYTPLEGMKKAKAEQINMSVLNVVEDSRIERKIKNKYPGIRAPFIKAYSELFENNFFDTEGKVLSKYNFIDRVNLHCKIGASLALPFTDEERALLDEVESTETYEQAVELTKKICDFMEKQDQEEFELVTIKKSAGDGLEDGDENIGEADFQGQGQEEDDDEIGNENDETEKIEGKGLSEQNGGDIAGQGASRNTGPQQIRSFTDEAYRKNEEKLFNKDKNTKYVYANIPVYDTNKVVDYKKVYSRYKAEGYSVPLERFAAYRRESSKVVSYLVKEFELRKNADQLKRAQVAKTGELNMNRIYAYNFTDDIFKKMTVLPDGKSHGLVMFLDWSGSMTKHISNTVKQLLNLALFCKKVNIPFEVYAFIENTDYTWMSTPVPVKGNLAMHDFGIVNLLSNRMNASEFSTAGAALMKMSGCGEEAYRYDRVHTPDWLSFSGTPLNEAIIAAMEIVPKFQNRNKLQIVNTVFLTDGEGNTLHRVYDDFNLGVSESGYTHMHIMDPKNRHTEIYERQKFYWGSHNAMAQTDCLIRLLKQRTGSHVIGFFVGELKDIMNRVDYFWPKSDDKDITGRYHMKEDIKERFRKESSLVVTSTGFDDYYILRSNGLDTDDNEELVFKENATTRGMVSAFSKYNSKKVTSRVVLNRFIDLIA